MTYANLRKAANKGLKGLKLRIKRQHLGSACKTGSNVRNRIAIVAGVKPVFHPLTDLLTPTVMSRGEDNNEQLYAVVAAQCSCFLAGESALLRTATVEMYHCFISNE